MQLPPTTTKAEMQYVISPIVQACDAISGQDPVPEGDHAAVPPAYQDLENLAMSYNGVEKAYADPGRS